MPVCSSCTNNNSLFCGLKANEREVFSENKKFQFYKKGESIFTEGKRAIGLFCIFKGKAKLHKRGSDGRDIVTRLVNEGEILGYRALLGDDSYRATATAVEDSYICKISKKVFLDELHGNRHISANIIRILTLDLAQSEDNIIYQSQANVSQRIARVLLLLRTKYGMEQDGRTLAVSLTRRDIGEIAGTTTESAIRSLAALNRNGIINLRNKKIILTDLEKLEGLTLLME